MAGYSQPKMAAARGSPWVERGDTPLFSVDGAAGQDGQPHWQRYNKLRKIIDQVE